MTQQLRNEQHLAIVIDLLHEIIDSKLNDIQYAEDRDESARLIEMTAALSRTAYHLNQIMRTYDLPYPVNENPPDWRRGR